MKPFLSFFSLFAIKITKLKDFITIFALHSK